MQRVIHDAAWATTVNIMDCILPVLRPEEVKDVADVVYEAVKAGIEAAFAAKAHEQARLAPCQN